MRRACTFSRSLKYSVDERDKKTRKKKQDPKSSGRVGPERDITLVSSSAKYYVTPNSRVQGQNRVKCQPFEKSFLKCSRFEP